MDLNDIDDDTLDQLADRLAERLDPGAYGDRVVLSRRQLVGVATGVLGTGALLSLGVDPAAAQAAGSVGTSSDPVDVFAYDLDVSNGVTSSLAMNGNDITGAGSVSTGELDINNERFTATGDSGLDQALSNVSRGGVIYLQNMGDINADRTITTRGISIVGTGTNAGLNVISGANWTIDAGEVDIVSITMSDTASLTFNKRRGAVYACQFFPTTNITTQADAFRFVNNQDGDVTFASGTSGGLVDACVGTTATDNGTNTIGNIG